MKKPILYTKPSMTQWGVKRARTLTNLEAAV